VKISINAGITSLNEKLTLDVIPTCMVVSKYPYRWFGYL
jgi:hypothetical protein